MVIVNATPDSFSDGHPDAGRFETHWASVAPRLERAVKAGALLIDVGAESTRPGAAPVDAAEEWARLAPFLDRIVREYPHVQVSVDTMKADVFRRAVDRGAHWLNDVSAGEASGDETLRIAARHGCPAVLMHRRGTPSTMQSMTEYADVVAEVAAALEERTKAAAAAGLAADRVLWDPGIGFAKTADQNLALLRAVARWSAAGRAVLVGASRKKIVGDLTGRPVDERLAGTLGLQIAAAARGARVIRCHDAAEFVDAWTTYRAVMAD